MRRSHLAIVALAACATIGFNPAVAEPATAVSVGQDEPVLYFAGTPDQSFGEQVFASVQGDPAATEAAQEVVSSLLARAEGGDDLNLPGSAGGASSDEETLRALDEALNGVSPALASPATDVTAEPASMTVTPASIPEDFKIRGYAETIYKWFFRMEIDAGFCGSNDCEVTDKLRQTWRLNPGRTGDVFTWTSIYSPNTGILENIYANGYVYCTTSFDLCGGDLLGEGGARDGNGSGSVSIPHDSNAGRKLVDAVRLRATLNTRGQRYYDFARTGTASCGTGDNRNCIF